MALIKCAECGKEISTNAKACPSCGGPSKQATSTLTWVIAILMFAGIGSSITKSCTAQEEATAREASKSPEQLAAEKREDAEQQALLLKVAIYARALKKAAKNPDSFQLESAHVTKGGAMCLSFRARNSFNALVPGAAVVSPDGKQTAQGSDEDVARLWNRHCANKEGQELVSMVRHMI